MTPQTKAGKAFLDRLISFYRPTPDEAEQGIAAIEQEARHRYWPCDLCGGSPDIHNTNRGPDYIGHEYR